MRTLLDKYTLEELLEVVNVSDVIELMRKDSFYSKLSEMEAELDDDLTMDLLIENGYGHDIGCFIVDNFGSEFTSEQVEDPYIEYLRNIH